MALAIRAALEAVINSCDSDKSKFLIEPTIGSIYLFGLDEITQIEGRICLVQALPV